jgi:hypothetical protein
MQPITKFHLIESAFLLSVPLFAYVAETVCGPGTNHWSPWHWVALVYALYCVHLGFFYRRKLMMKAKAALAAKPSDKTSCASGAPLSMKIRFSRLATWKRVSL